MIPIYRDNCTQTDDDEDRVSVGVQTEDISVSRVYSSETQTNVAMISNQVFEFHRVDPGPLDLTPPSSPRSPPKRKTSPETHLMRRLKKKYVDTPSTSNEPSTSKSPIIRVPLKIPSNVILECHKPEYMGFLSTGDTITYSIPGFPNLPKIIKTWIGGREYYYAAMSYSIESKFDAHTVGIIACKLYKVNELKESFNKMPRQYIKDELNRIRCLKRNKGIDPSLKSEMVMENSSEILRNVDISIVKGIEAYVVFESEGSVIMTDALEVEHHLSKKNTPREIIEKEKSDAARVGEMIIHLNCY